MSFKPSTLHSPTPECICYHNCPKLKYHKEQASRLTVENRVLRREQRSGKRDDVITQLEVELARCEEERATMEENLSQSFNTVIKELVASVASLQEQKRDLLVRIEDQSGKKGGLFTKT